MYVGMNYINGDFCPHRPDFSSINPSTEAELGIFPRSTYDEVHEAVEVARKAQRTWRELSRVVRAEYFDKLCEVLKAKKDYVVKAISLETGKTQNESLAEVNEALHMAQYTFGMGRMPHGECIASEIAAKDSYVIRKPKGVVAVVAPWNFPFAIGGFWCAAPALLEGNTVVFKPSEDTPMVGQIIAELYQEAGFPPGVFNLVHGDGGVGDMLVNSKVDHICFTGSAAVGQYIRQVCANTWHKTCSCELGSKSAVVVFADADMDLALAACIASAYKLSGQRCVSAGRLLVEHKIYYEFTSKFVELSKKVKIGDPFDEPDSFMGPLIRDDQRTRVRDSCRLYNKHPNKRTSRKRYFQIENYFHHASKFIIDLCIKHGIGRIIIGKNDGWKQEVKMRKPQKQNFQYIPFYRFIEKVKYKAVLAGISVDFTEEAYTSKASFLDHDELPVWDAEPPVLSGKRNKGMYQTFRPIHADVNGSLNIGRKVIGDKVYETFPDRSIAAMPVRVNPLKAFCV